MIRGEMNRARERRGMRRFIQSIQRCGLFPVWPQSSRSGSQPAITNG